MIGIKRKGIFAISLTLIVATACVAYCVWGTVAHKQRSAGMVEGESYAPDSRLPDQELGERQATSYAGTPPIIRPSQIEHMLQNPPPWPDNVVNSLVALGPQAIPAIGEVLAKGIDRPMALIRTLEALGDPRGADVTLSFLKSMPSDGSVDEGGVIRALIAMRNENACGPVGAYLRDNSKSARTRLAAVETVSRLCSGAIVREAAELALDYYRNRQKLHEEGVEDLYSALAEVQSDEARDIVVEVISTETSPHKLEPIIAAAIRRRDPRLTDGLKNLMQNPSVEWHMRVKAAKAILDLEVRPDESLYSTLNDLVSIAEADGVEDNLRQARDLKRAYEQRR